jgi:hypothetical protein
MMIWQPLKTRSLYYIGSPGEGRAGAAELTSIADRLAHIAEANGRIDITQSASRNRMRQIRAAGPRR